MDKQFWEHKRVLVTGGNGFLGKSLVPQLMNLGARIYIPRSKEYDLRNETLVEKLFNKVKPDFVIHMAAHGGGIEHMRKHPGTIFYDNIMMNSLVIEMSRRYNVKKFVGIGTVCSYPKFTQVPFDEKDLWEGYPEATNAPYGLAKKMMLVQTHGYHQEFGFNGIHLLLVNMYGPYDDFNLESSHVVPALIRKFLSDVKTNRNKVTVWGTGKVSREFLYVEDSAEAIILATEKYNKSEPVNIGAGFEISVKDLVELIAKLTGFKGKIIWDTTKPDGQPRRCLDTTKAKKEFGFKAKTPLEEGLRKTIEWYRKKLRPKFRLNIRASN